MTAFSPFALAMGVQVSAAERAKAEPWRWVHWLPLQMRYLTSLDRYRLMRAGNQLLGKSTVALADIGAHALGEHPYRPDGRAEAGEYWVICAAWAQSISIQGKLHDLLPPDRVHPSSVFSKATGYRGKNPAVQVQHRNGDWSIIRFKTTNQGPLNLAGATIAGALFDEPPKSERVYTEVAQRVKASGGWVAVSMTPINAPVGWIKDRAEAGFFEDLHALMTPEQLIPVGATHPRQLPDGTICDAAYIALERERTPSHEVPVIIDGEWEVRTLDRYFSNFHSSGDKSHVHKSAPDGEFRLLLGIDHGDRPGKQCAVLVAVQDTAKHPIVYVIDEYTDTDGTATPEDDAEGIVDMLALYSWGWPDIDEAWGDRVHLKGRARQKSNKDLAVHLARLQRIPREQMKPPLRTVKRGAGRGAGSLTVGSRWLFNTISRPGCFGIHPRCVRLIDGLDNWDFRDTDHKDPIDALRYALDSYIFGVRRGKVRPLRSR